MHELAIAEAIVDVVVRHAGGRRVARVELEVGRLRQVVPQALAFGFELVSVDTVAEGAELVLEDVPVTLACRACGAETQLAFFPLVCGSCGAMDVEVTSGEELHVTALELEDDPVGAVGSG
jgi:hydrogenase nickel incorporation protein HypA/HybF